MADANFTNLADHLARARIDFSADTFKALLVTAVPSATDLDTWVARADVTTETSGTGYTAGGFAVTPAVGALDTTNNLVPITWAPTAANPQYTASTISAVGAIIYQSTGAAANDLLVSFVDFGGPVASSNGNYSVTFTGALDIDVG